jgi:anti-anti-sigma regulatory factor
MIIEARKSRITLCGAIERNHWKTIRAAAQLLLEHSPGGIVIDCRQINKMTPAGAVTFEQGMDEVTAQGYKIIFAGLPRDLRQIVGKIPGLRSEMVVMDTVEEAERLLGIETRYTEKPVGTGEINVVVMGGNLAEKPAIALSCLLGNRRLTRLHITNMVEIPHFLPLSASTSQIEEAGRALDSAKSFAHDHGFPPTVEIAHVRTLEAGLTGVLSDLSPTAVFLAVPRGETRTLSRLIHAGMDLHILLGGESLSLRKDSRPILIPIHEKLDTSRVVTLANRLSILQNREIILCDVVEVSRTLPLVVPVSYKTIASHALTKISKHLREDRINHKVIVHPVRDFTLGLKNIIKAISPGLVILDPLAASEGEKIMAATVPDIGCDLLWLTRSHGV